MKKFWEFRAKADEAGELMLYGDISSSSWFGDEVTPKEFKKDLDALGAVKRLDIYINSGGGDVFAGQAIYNMLRRHDASKTVYIDGLAASIASVIAMAGDKVVMPKNAMLMIHNGWTIAMGNKELLRQVADSLEKIDESIRSVYASKTGKSDDELSKLMDAETWMTADEAVAAGFADEIEADKRVAASLDGACLTVNGIATDLSRYHNRPAVEPAPPPEASDLNDSGGESRPVSDPNRFNRTRSRILNA